MGEGINKARANLGAFPELSREHEIEKGCSVSNKTLGKRDAEL